MLKNLPEKTGRTMDQWMSFLSGRESEKHSILVKAIKDEGVGHSYANLIAQTLRAGGALPSAAPDAGEAEALVDAQYVGKEGLRPLYDVILAFARQLGPDVGVAPKKTYVSLRRSKQFAIVQPSTRTRLDLGLKLGNTEPGGRLEASGSFNAMVSHRVRLEEPRDFDAQVEEWLRQAYQDA